MSADEIRMQLHSEIKAAEKDILDRLVQLEAMLDRIEQMIREGLEAVQEPPTDQTERLN